MTDEYFIKEVNKNIWLFSWNIVLFSSVN
jgi:hypothetical protein